MSQPWQEDMIIFESQGDPKLVRLMITKIGGAIGNAAALMGTSLQNDMELVDDDMVPAVEIVTSTIKTRMHLGVTVALRFDMIGPEKAERAPRESSKAWQLGREEGAAGGKNRSEHFAESDARQDYQDGWVAGLAERIARGEAP